MKFKKVTAYLACFFLVMNILVFPSINAKAADTTTANLYYTVDSNVAVGQDFNIYVNAQNINDLYGGSIDFAYDKSMIQIQDISEGDLIKNCGTTYNLLVKSTLPDTTGIINFAFSLQGDGPGIANANGKLFVIKAKALKAGNLGLNFISSDPDAGNTGGSLNALVKLSDSEGGTISLVTSNLTSNISTVPTVPSSQTIEETNTSLVYTGTWTSITGTGYSGGTGKYALASGASVEYKFTGTSVKWISYKALNRGKADVYIDGVLDANVDLYSATEQTKTTVYQKSGLTNALHTIKIVATGQKNPSSSNTIVIFDAFEINSNTNTPTDPQPQTIEETNTSLVYTGTWTSITGTGYSGGTGKYALASGASVEYKFTGTSVKWISYKALNRGKADVYIDGVLDANVDLYSATEQTKTTVYQKSGLTNALHTIKIVATGQKNPSSSNTIVIFDAFEINSNTTIPTDPQPQTIEETNTSLVYTGTWTSITGT
ncbi:hypothetical protein JK636_11210, partial [Clostridium sp. YIM B02515]